MIQKILLFVSCLLTVCSCTTKTQVDNHTVPNLDLKKYSGTWYEIARLPHSFEKDLVGVTAYYILRDDGKIRVINSGRKHTLEGESKVKGGIVKVPDPKDPAKLKVSFFWFFYADYYVMELDTVDYSYALVGSSSPDYLWILSRTPSMDPITYHMLINKAKARGYDTSKLIEVEQAP